MIYKTNLQKYQCKQCKKNFNILTGTLFEDHKIAITEWMVGSELNAVFKEL